MYLCTYIYILYVLYNIHIIMYMYVHIYIYVYMYMGKLTHSYRGLTTSESPGLLPVTMIQAEARRLLGSSASMMPSFMGRGEKKRLGNFPKSGDRSSGRSLVLFGIVMILRMWICHAKPAKTGDLVSQKGCQKPKW